MNIIIFKKKQVAPKCMCAANNVLYYIEWTPYYWTCYWIIGAKCQIISPIMKPNHFAIHEERKN